LDHATSFWLCKWFHGNKEHVINVKILVIKTHHLYLVHLNFTT
jgi:hypothetical protein